MLENTSPSTAQKCWARCVRDAVSIRLSLLARNNREICHNLPNLTNTLPAEASKTIL
jgi:hypothetical protein